MDDKGLQQLLLAVLSGDPDKPIRALNAESAGCPPLPRVRTALLREDWSEAEELHRLGCSQCKQVETQARSHLWHPPLVPLFWHARGLNDSDADVAHHLQADACRRCLRLAGLFQIDRVLGRLVARVRQGVEGIAARLTGALATCSVAPLALATAGGETAMSFEDGRGTCHLSRNDPLKLRLERRGLTGDAPRLVCVLVGDQSRNGEHFALLRPGRDGHPASAEIFLDAPLPPRSLLTLYEVEPGLLARDDLPRLQAAQTLAGKAGRSADAWKTWAGLALKHPDLDAAVRPSLEALARGADRPPPARR